MMSDDQLPVPASATEANQAIGPADAMGPVEIHWAEPIIQPAPLAGPILCEARWKGKLTHARAHVAVVVVYRRGNHQVIWPHERTRVLLHRRPETVYEVDLGLHRTVITADLPDRDYAGAFHASISVQWRVFDPSAVVRHRVLDIGEALAATLLRRARRISRDFGLDQVIAAEDEINDQLGGVTIDVSAPTQIEQAMREATSLGCLGAEYGLWTRVITHLTLDRAATEHNTKIMQLNWAIEEEEVEQRLRRIKNRNQQEITAERMAVYRDIVAAGDVDQFALRLASHPDEISAITAIIREDQLTSRRDTIEFISRMVDSGVVERWEVSDQVREALEWLRDATARVVTNKDHKGMGDRQTVRPRRRGRDKPIEDSPPPGQPADVILVTAEAIQLDKDTGAEPSTEASMANAKTETAALPPPPDN